MLVYRSKKDSRAAQFVPKLSSFAAIDTDRRLT